MEKVLGRLCFQQEIFVHKRFHDYLLLSLKNVIKPC